MDALFMSRRDNMFIADNKTSTLRAVGTQP